MKRTPLKRKPRGRRVFTPDERLAARFWHAAVVRKGCAMCQAVPLTPDERAHRGRIEAHHVVPKRWLKDNGFGDRLWDVRNGLGLCELHHTRHTRAFQRVARSALSDDARDFAAEVRYPRMEVDYR